MTQREVVEGNEVYECPSCGKRLTKDGEVWTCVQHGAFFAYSPQLLVRAPEETERVQTPMPWDAPVKTGAK